MAVNRGITSDYGILCFTVTVMSLMHWLLFILRFSFRACVVLFPKQIKGRRMPFFSLISLQPVVKFWEAFRRLPTRYLISPGVAMARRRFAIIAKRLYCIDRLLERKSGTMLLCFLLYPLLHKKVGKGAINKVKISNLLDNTAPQWLHWCRNTLLCMVLTFLKLCPCVANPNHLLNEVILDWSDAALGVVKRSAQNVSQQLFDHGKQFVCKYSFRGNLTFRAITSSSFVLPSLMWLVLNSKGVLSWTAMATPAGDVMCSSFSAALQADTSRSSWVSFPAV